MTDITKFKLGELFSASNGKTSMALLCAFFLIVTACGTFIYGAYLKNSEILINSTAFATLGSTLLGIRRFTAEKEINSN